MANQKISTYITEVLALAPNDIFDVSKEISPGVFDSQRLKYSTLLTELNTDLTVPNFANTDLTLTGNRIHTLGVNDLTFASAGDANLLKLETTGNNIGIGVAAPLAKLDLLGNVIFTASAQGNPLIVRDYLGNDMINVFRNASSKVIKIGDIALNMQTIIQGVTGDVFVVTANGVNDYCHIGGDPDADAYFNLYRSNVAEGPRVSINTDSLTDTYFDIIANFGIGTTTPTEKFELVGAAKILNGIGTNGESPSASVAVRTALNTTAISFGASGGACFGQVADNTEISTVISSKDIRFKQGGNHVATINRATTGMLQSIFTIRGQGATGVLTDRFSQVDFLSNYWNGAASQDKTASWKHNTINTSGNSEFNLDIGGTVTVRFDETTTATETRFMVYDVDNAALERVTVGIADSGGVGFKLLRIPN